VILPAPPFAASGGLRVRVPHHSDLRKKLLGKRGIRLGFFSQEKFRKIEVTSLILISHESFSFLQTRHFGEKKFAKKDVPVEKFRSPISNDEQF